MNIDIVIPWCGNDFDPNIHTSHEDLLRQSNNNELYYCLKSIEAFAPWVHKIYVLVNGSQRLQNTPQQNKTVFIDRIKLFDGKKITNGLVAETLSWKIPELNENFILAHDDIILGRPTYIEDFFDINSQQSIYYHYDPIWGPFKNQPHHRIYSKEIVFKNKTPLSCGPYPHFYLSMKKSICEKIENEYKEWFQFMRSHYEYRYSSNNNKYFSMEEDFKGVYISHISSSNSGIYNPLCKTKHRSYYDFSFISHNNDCYDTRLSLLEKNYIPCNDSIKKFKHMVTSQGICPLFIGFNNIGNELLIEEILSFCVAYNNDK